MIVCMYEKISACCYIWQLEEDIKSPGTGVAGNYKPPCTCWDQLGCSAIAADILNH